MQGAEGEVHGLAYADGDQDFLFRIVRDVEILLDAARRWPRAV